MQFQYSVHTPNTFIQTHLDQLLPGWTAPVLSVLIVLQACPFTLLHKTSETELYKDKLRQQFFRLGVPIAHHLQTLGYLADLFDPQTGWPLLSKPGFVQLDDVAVVQSSLGYARIISGGCAIVEHPEWGHGVYPSILVSSAAPQVVAAVAEDMSLAPSAS